VDDTETELLQALVRGFDRAMLVSRCGDGMRARPTTVANTNDSRRLWLLSGIVGDPLDELNQDPNVNVVMQDETRFCSVTGTARIARASGEEPIWNEEQRVWLTRSAHRSSLLLIEVAPQYAEYWDRSGLRGVRFDTPRPAAHERPSVARSEAGSARPRARLREREDNVIILEQARWRR
jgi:general stress protein 26